MKAGFFLRMKSRELATQTLGNQPYGDLIETGPKDGWCSKKSALEVSPNMDPYYEALFPNSSFELIVGFYMWAPLKV